MAESIQHKLSRVRPPRVHITYDVEIGNAIVMKELPFVMGVMADLSGQSKVTRPKLKDRKFIYIDRDNFNDIMKSFAPRVAVQVKNTLSGSDSAKANVELTFNDIEDFNPRNIIDNVPGLKKLYESRVRMNDILAALEGNDELEEMLAALLTDSSARKSLKSELSKLDSKK